jgi:peptidoglycan hydrolase CwlO-like protein
MGDKRLVNRTVVIGTVILCVALLIGLVGAVITYNSMLATKDSIIASKDLQIADENSQISDMETVVGEKQSEIDDLDSQIAQKNSTIANLNQQISQKDNQISSLNNQISQKDDIITNLNNQDSVIADLNGQISQKNSQISSLTSQVASLNSQISQKDSTIANLTTQLSLLESMTNSLASEISDLNSQILTLNNQIANLQTQNDDLTLEIATLNSEMAGLQLAYDNYVADYQNLIDIINQRSMHSNISDFITPQDPEVTSIVYSITGGWSDTSDWNEFWTDVKALYTWIRTNIEYRSDGLSPVLPFNPSNDLYYRAEMWQFPNETLELEKGDCEDQALLLCSMIRCYSGMNYSAECVWITSSIVGHVGVQIPVSGDELVIFDPAGNYYSKDILGNIVFNDISVEIDNWLNYWKSQGIGSDVYVYRVFSDYVDEAFSSTSEYLSWMYS